MIDIGHNFLFARTFMVPFKFSALGLYFWTLPITAQGQAPVVATCNAGFEWSFNSLNQSPCQLANYLGGTCIGGPFGIPPLPNNSSFYNGVSLGENNTCRCSSVFYSVLSACSNCQLRKWKGLADFTQKCMTIYMYFPHDIPSETKIPSWAYLDVRQSNHTFDPQQAQRNSEDGKPESTGPPSQSSKTESTNSSTPTSSSSSLSLHSPPSSNLRIGPIIGGIITSVIALLIAGLLVFRLNKTRRANKNKQEILISHVEPFTTALDTDSGSRLNKKQMLLGQVETLVQKPLLSSSHAPIADMQVQQLMDGISVVHSTYPAQPNVAPSREEMYDRINVLARENAVLREQALPPEYEGSTVGFGSRLATLPPYSHGDGHSHYDHHGA